MVRLAVSNVSVGPLAEWAADDTACRPTLGLGVRGPTRMNRSFAYDPSLLSTIQVKIFASESSIARSAFCSVP